MCILHNKTSKKKVLIFVYQWLALKDLRDFFYRLCNPISLVHCKCIVWPHLKTVISLVESNRYWKQINPKIKTLLCYVVKEKFSGYDSFYLKTNRAIVMHCTFYTSVLVLHNLGVATSCPKKNKIRARNKEYASR